MAGTKIDHEKHRHRGKATLSIADEGDRMQADRASRWLEGSVAQRRSAAAEKAEKRRQKRRDRKKARKKN